MFGRHRTPLDSCAPTSRVYESFFKMDYLADFLTSAMFACARYANTLFRILSWCARRHFLSVHFSNKPQRTDEKCGYGVRYHLNVSVSKACSFNLPSGFRLFCGPRTTKAYLYRYTAGPTFILFIQYITHTFIFDELTTYFL